jgi:hypothetical protein
MASLVVALARPSSRCTVTRSAETRTGEATQATPHRVRAQQR